ncbi:MAG: hypothetical protein WDZ94_04485 [Patescibacteria group bacterium]
MAKFIFKKQNLIDNIGNLKKAFEDKQINFDIFYSVKTNFSSPVLETINELCNFEIVSAYEWELVKKFKPKELVLNGPSKSEDLIKDIIESGVTNLYFNIDNDTDIEIIQNLPSKYLDKVKIGLRVYLDKNDVWNRFGFNIDSEKTIEIIKSLKNNLRGFHFHFSTNNFNINNYALILNKIEKLTKEYNLNIEYIDMGGGLPGADESLMNKMMYSDLPSSISEFTNKFGKNFRIISEVGRNLVQNVFDLESNIVSTKLVESDIVDVVIDTNIMHFPCFWEKKFGIEYFPINKERQVNTINIFGNSCMQVDKILENQLITFKPKVGDKIVLTNVGAYSLSQASNFISKIPDIEERE